MDARSQLAAITRGIPGRWLRAATLLPFGYYVAMLVLVLAHYAQTGDRPGFDGWLYREAAATWLAGGDPWSVGLAHAHFAGAPSTILTFVPTVVVPGEFWRPASVVLMGAAGWFALRRLELPAYWILYTPLTIGVLLGQPGVLVLALLLTRVAPLAPIFKGFAGLPLLWRPRQLIVAIAIGLATVVVAWDLWWEWFRRLPELSSRLAAELHGGEPWWLLVAGAAALLLIIRQRPEHARWLVVAAIWPLPEYHYAILALPTGLPWLLFAMAIVPGPLPVIAYAVFLVIRPHLVDRLAFIGPSQTLGGAGSTPGVVGRR